MRKELLIEALSELLEVDEKFILNNYLDSIEKDNILNSPHIGVTSAMYYLIKRKAKRPLTLDQVSSKFEVERREIGRIYIKLKKLIGIKACQEHSILKTSCLVVQKPSQYLPNFISKLELSDKDKSLIFEECKRIGKKVWQPGKYQIIGFCCGLIYLSALVIGKKQTQRSVADACNVTECCARENFKKIFDEAGIDEEDLNFKIAEIIRGRLENGEKGMDLAKEYGVYPGNISAIKHNMEKRIIELKNKYESKAYLIDDKKIIYKLDCKCGDFTHRRIKQAGQFSDIKTYEIPCKHLKPVVDALIKQGYTLKSPKPMTGTDRCSVALRRKIMERSGGMCEMPIWSGQCPHKIDEIHRKIPKTNGGKYNEDNCIGLCIEHHKIVTFQKWHGSPGAKK